MWYDIRNPDQWHFIASTILEESSFCWDSGVKDLYWWYICHDHQPPSFSPTWWGDIGVMFHVFQNSIFVCWLVFVFVCKSRFRNSLKRPKLVSAPGRPSVLQRHKLIGKIASLFFQLSGNIDIMISASMSDKVCSFSKQSPKAQLFCRRNICQDFDLLQLCARHSFKSILCICALPRNGATKTEEKGHTKETETSEFQF